MDYFIIAMPRSRTAWLSTFLTYGPSFCYHEPLAHCRNVGELEGFRPGAPIVGAADTMALLVLPKLVSAYPQARYVIVHRDENDVADSCRALNLPNADGIPMLARRLKYACLTLKERPYIETQFDKLSDMAELRRIWEFCVGRGFYEERARALVGMNIQMADYSVVRETETMGELLSA